MFACDESSLGIEGQPVCSRLNTLETLFARVATGSHEDTDTIALFPFENRVAGNFGEEKEILLAVPERSLSPGITPGQLFCLRICRNDCVEMRVKPNKLHICSCIYENGFYIQYPIEFL